jgi:hypothetical protein
MPHKMGWESESNAINWSLRIEPNEPGDWTARQSDLDSELLTWMVSAAPLEFRVKFAENCSDQTNGNKRIASRFFIFNRLGPSPGHDGVRRTGARRPPKRPASSDP